MCASGYIFIDTIGRIQADDVDGVEDCQIRVCYDWLLTVNNMCHISIASTIASDFHIMPSVTHGGTHIHMEPMPNESALYLFSGPHLRHFYQ